MPTRPASELNSGLPIVQGSSALGVLTAAILFGTLATGLVLPKMAGAGMLALGLAGLLWLGFHKGRIRPRATAHERLLVLAVCLYVAVWLLGWLIDGLDPAGLDSAGGVLRLLLIIPIYFFLRRVDGLESVWWAGLATGAIGAGLYAIWFAVSGQPGEWHYRAGGPTNPIYFGGIVLAFGLMLLPRVAERGLDWPLRVSLAVAVALALAASALSGSRGAWLALVPILLLYVFTMGSRQEAARRFGVPLGLVAAAAAIIALPAVPLGERLLDGAARLGTLDGAPAAGDTLAIRWQMWLLALELARDHWLTGAGPGAFRAALDAAVADGRLDPLFLEYRHPHNEFLSALVHAGLPGLLALLGLFAVPALRFARLTQTGLDATRLYGWCGLVAMLVLATMAFSESIFERNNGIIWFVLLTAVTPALVHARRRRALVAERPERDHGLSVIVICKNEADRIEACLRSVAGWADEIVVLDSGSTDGTPEICRRYTDRVEVTDWPGFGRQKQRALNRAGHEWVLSLDADEVVSDELRREIDVVLAGDEPHFDGYLLPWSIRAFGRRHRFGHWSRAPLRLFRKSAARFTDVPVHEKVVLSGDNARAGRLEGPLYHDIYRDLKHAREKLSAYARLQARVRHGRGRRASRTGAWLRAAVNLVDNYLLRGAFLDGRAGWTMAWLHAWYTFEKYDRLHRLSGRDGNGQA